MLNILEQLTVKENYPSKIHVNYNNRHCENSTNFNIILFSTKIHHFLSKSPKICEFHLITLSLLLNNTVPQSSSFSVPLKSQVVPFAAIIGMSVMQHLHKHCRIVHCLDIY